MALDQQLIDEILHQADIVDIVSSYIQVTKKGRNFVALCPFHDDKNPSMMISKDKQIYKCFVCGEGGNAFTFVQHYEKISFTDAVRKVASLIGFDDARLHENVKANREDDTLSSLYKAIEDLTSFYEYNLKTEEGRIAFDYLNKRTLSQDMIKKFRLGYAPKDGKVAISYLESKGHSYKTMETIGIANHGTNGYSDRNAGRVIFPICNADGRVIGFSARRLVDDQEVAKYVNSPETPLFHKANVIYNYHNAFRFAKRDGFVYVLEGFMDVFALERINIESSVALMGTALTKEHVSLLRGLGAEVRLCFDGDKPGQMATLKASKILEGSGINYRIVDSKNELRDPDEILNQNGEPSLRKYLGTLQNSVDFSMEYYKTINPLNTVESRKKFIESFMPFLLNIRSALELGDYIYKIADITRFDARAIKELVDKARKNEAANNNVNVMSSFHPERKVLKRLQKAEREVLYQMLHDVKAVSFYEDNIETFYDEIYRSIANYIVDYAKNHDKIVIEDIIAQLDDSNLQNKKELINEVSSLSFDETHAPCSDMLLNDCKRAIDTEKERIYQKEVLEKSLEGKSEKEKARIASDYARRIAVKRKKNS